MNAEQWAQVQASLHPKDLETVQAIAQALASDTPLAYVTDGSLSACIEGPGILPVARALLVDFFEFSQGRGPGRHAPSAAKRPKH